MSHEDADVAVPRAFCCLKHIHKYCISDKRKFAELDVNGQQTTVLVGMLLLENGKCEGILFRLQGTEIQVLKL